MRKYRDYLDSPHVGLEPEPIAYIKGIINTLSDSSADCERGFSTMNNICSVKKAKLLLSNMSNLIFISLVGPPISVFNPAPCVKIRSEADTDTQMTLG